MKGGRRGAAVLELANVGDSALREAGVSMGGVSCLIPCTVVDEAFPEKGPDCKKHI